LFAFADLTGQIRDAYGSDGLSVHIEDGGRHAVNPFFVFSPIQGVTPLAGGLQFGQEIVAIGNGIRGKPTEADALKHPLEAFRREEGEDGLAHARAVSGGPGPDPGIKGERPGSLDFVEINDFGPIQSTEVHGGIGFLGKLD
jgi:hypothetical protein